MNPILDSFDEAVLALTRHPLRSVLTAIGVMLGLGLYVASTTLTATAQADIRAAFDELRARQVVVSGDLDVPDADAMLTTAGRINGDPGVASGGIVGVVGRLPVSPPPSAPSSETVLVVTDGALDALGAELRSGRRFTPFEVASGSRVALVGSLLADSLRVGDETPGFLLIDGIPFRVVGEVGSVDREQSVLLAVLVPPGPAFELWGSPDRIDVVAVARSAAETADVARRLPLIADPTGQAGLEAATLPDASQLGVDVDRRLEELTTLLSVGLLFAGISVVAGSTLISALERRREFGIRRALGFSRLQIALVVVAEAGTLTWVAGSLGVALALFAVSTIGAAREWTLTIDWRSVALATGAALIAGPLAGLGPAVRASSVDPIDAIRQ